MKSYIKSSLLIVAAGLGMASCSDFLEKEPTDQGTEAIMFKNPEQFKAAANALYGGSGLLPDWKSINVDGNTDISGIGSNGGGFAPQNTGNWNDPYARLRTDNILLEKAAQYAGDLDAMTDSHPIAESVGTAYFFRAWSHFMMVQRFGGVPIVDHVMDIPDLYGPRNSRYEVIDLVVKDLNRAIALLPKRSTKDRMNDRGKLSKEVAQSFLARVALYEGTWEKYTAGLSVDLDGDGESVGAGKNKPAGYPSITEFLTIAKNQADAVIKEAETGTFEIWMECDTLSYYSLFNIDDGEGNISNHKGVGKSTNKEFIWVNPFDYTLKRSGTNTAHKVGTSQMAGMSAYLGESFLCYNGLPTHYSEDGVNIIANPEFGGYDTPMGEYRNRDWRFYGVCSLPDRPQWCAKLDYGTPRTEVGPLWPEPIYVTDNEHYNASDPAYSSRRGVFNPYIGINSTHNWYGNRKYAVEGVNRADNLDAADIPLIRLAEVYLIYCEAICELDGTVSDADLDRTINKLRKRGNVAPLRASLIAGKYDATWFNFETGRHELHKMTMLDEIRRERMCELFGEGFRMDDLKRWGIAHINLTGQKLGRKILGTYYGDPANKCNDKEYFGTPVYDPQTRPLLYGLVSEDPNDIDYGRPIATIPGNCLFSVKDYLDPLPIEQIRLNPNLKQNPGW
ncbi:MAG: RagB/SusD family nutrient uptake outer membrane protein [Muribaculaceae bacterium]|nr:RagB/SusD family nutrient uptake outer membrane protein [Muribaculaceae bacterium]